MSFELCRGEPLAENVVQLAGEGLDQVLAVLPSHGGVPTADAVHPARRTIKKLRALLRFVRPGLDDATFARENTALRDAGRALSAVRDAQVLIPAFDDLRRETAGRVAPGAAAAIHRHLLDDARATQADADAHGNVPAAVETLRHARARVADWSPGSPDGWRVPGRGLRAIYRKGRRAMRRADTAPAEEDFHEWRKQVKYLAAQVHLLRPIRRGKLRRLGKKLDHMADVLGQEHDLSVLRARVAGLPESEASARDREIVGRVIDGRRRALQAEALALGREVYDKKPRRFGQSFKRHWEKWQGGGKAGG